MEEPIDAAAPGHATRAGDRPHVRKTNARVRGQDAMGLLPPDAASEGLRKMVALAARTRPSERALLDAALMLMTTAGLLRPSEAAALRRSDVRISETGVRIRLASQRGVRSVWIERSETETCAVAALERWIEVATGREGPLFCRIGSDGEPNGDAVGSSYVARTFRRYALRAGLDAGLFAPMSLRAVFIARAFCADPVKFRRLAPHLAGMPVDHVLRYYRPADPKRANP